jgi:ATP-dependent helicase/nuclease subunit A
MRFTVQPDSSLVFPSVTIVNASAGSGKTYNLTLRLVQFLLSDVIPRNDLKNVLAITFTNNAVREMRERAINELKRIALGENTAVDAILPLLSMSRQRAKEKAAEMVRHILEEYSDFQVKTIDSFLTAVFRECAIEHGFTPDVRIAIGDFRLIDQAFDTFARELEGERRAYELLEPLVELMQVGRKKDNSYIWDPYNDLARHVRHLYSLFGGGIGPTADRPYRDEMERCSENIRSRIGTIDDIIRQSGLVPKKNYLSFRKLALGGQMIDLVSRAPLTRPVRKPSTNPDSYDALSPEIERVCHTINDSLTAYASLHARHFYQPYLRALAMLSRTLQQVKRREGTVFLDDINVILQRHLDEHTIPEIYFRLGETLYHYLIDEFQDTAPIQWANLRPLIDNALSEGGSLFLVGDPKQSIYGFRGADWKIMKDLEHAGTFPSVRNHEVAYLEQNYRSAEHIVEFAREVFHTRVPRTAYAAPASTAGLTTYEQSVLPKKIGTGYVEVNSVAYDDELMPEKDRLMAIIEDLTGRGFRHRDIAVITPANDDVVRISGWLNDQGVPFISHSSLDIRRRKSVCEIVSLLRFLDSPVDDLSFADVVLGDLYGSWLHQEGHELRRTDIAATVFAARTSPKPIYTNFRARYPDIWSASFSHLLKMVGFLPLYDLVMECYKKLHVFEAVPVEEASLARLAGIVLDFEREGGSSVRDFLEFTSEEGEASRWELDVPSDLNAVSVMTVHKSKGLGFPATAVLLYDREDRRENMFLVEEHGEKQLLRITRATADRVPELGAIYDEQMRREQIDELNGLYVALTRAELEMFIIGVRSESERPPLLFLPEGHYVRGEKSTQASPPPPIDDRRTGLFHHSFPFRVEIARSETRVSSGAKRGDYVHLLLSRVEARMLSAEESLRAIVETLTVPDRDQALFADAADTVVRFLSDAAVKSLFQEEKHRTVMVEQEFVDAGGSVFRMDRITIDRDGVTVVDFKTGSMDHSGDHVAQVSAYQRLLRSVFPGRRITGIVAYVDHRVLMRLE